ncbi:RNase H domain-containing protein [Pochonia chlamydosporia 170]|uniref:RNase H domain-containing protein n=1 Tax=Pochonia chlamydosporia 170 TaxID=1380566 RepID=A0A219AQM8_METCM|nr:RNase H domain-containing protein [Pochonia chlamydosporia 170]OWT42475.1 RNase H domain-containing protein [Pochonia chlamydosporia 170]
MAPRQKEIPQGMDSQYSTMDVSLTGALASLAAEKFDAEIHGAVQGLRCALVANSANEPITVCMDNTSVIDCIGATAPNSSQVYFRAFQKEVDKYPYQISVKWCPGHSNIFGNS